MKYCGRAMVEDCSWCGGLGTAGGWAWRCGRWYGRRRAEGGREEGRGGGRGGVGDGIRLLRRKRLLRQYKTTLVKARMPPTLTTKLTNSSFFPLKYFISFTSCYFLATPGDFTYSKTIYHNPNISFFIFFLL